MKPQYLFTAASQRVVDFASDWTLCPDCKDLRELTAPALLLGLLSETECRAASLMADCGIDSEAVQHHWPTLTKIERPDRGTHAKISFSQEVQVSLQLVQKHLADLHHPAEIATEHILLGLLMVEHEVAAWLQQMGLDANLLNTQIHPFYGQSQTRHPTEMEPIPEEEYSEDGCNTEDSENACNTQNKATTSDWHNDAQLDQSQNYFGGSEEIAILRVLDAAENRAREGIRVVEDYVRFVLDDLHLTGLCKQLRHDLTAAAALLPIEHRLAARETQLDVGTGITTAAERCREDAANVLAANFARLQEAVRSLEEFGKVLIQIPSSPHTSPHVTPSEKHAVFHKMDAQLQDGVQINPDLAAACKQLRYRAYTLQRAVAITGQSIERLAKARLYVLIDGRDSMEAFGQLAKSLIAAGVHVLQLRDKRLDDRQLLERARLLRELTAGSDTLMIVNDRPDVAALARADGVHVGQEELSVKDARAIMGPRPLIGVSTHSIEQARQAVLDGANYIGVGPTFPSGTKQFDHFPGIDLLRAVAAEIRLPAFAIGGIHADNLNQVTTAGFSRIAVSGAVTAAADPAAAAQALLQMLESSRQQP
jgi:thiamine-phosphate pyrophosphorylase